MFVLNDNDVDITAAALSPRNQCLFCFKLTLNNIFQISECHSTIFGQCITKALLTTRVVQQSVGSTNENIFNNRKKSKID